MDKRIIYTKESLKLFLKFGVRSVTVGQITGHLNISSKTLYQLYGDKTGLVNACFQLYRDNSREEFDKLEADCTNVAELLVLFYNKMISSLSRINPNFLNDISNYFPEIWDSNEAFGVTFTKQILTRGVEEGIFHNSIDVEICAETLSLLLRSMFEKDPFSGRDSKKLLANMLWPFVRGICTEEGLTEFRKYRRFAVGV
ncbi:TetR/AcrR family transcriptional regulator [Pontibacter sp. G13]|uniref:TetR/AcrR family transcriptional regulator n=1 Tax=Pontibacter sp. G13 TaxID=3074898 RepID=UPI00288AE6D5|nr:TetR/AcrR family transcriptional regulator [Pontibacter sp. G13]WNJ18892.1 TetR/AcrR family transcriptional regulator [Pontibacter sp. G13]